MLLNDLLGMQFNFYHKVNDLLFLLKKYMEDKRACN